MRDSSRHVQPDRSSAPDETAATWTTAGSIQTTPCCAASTHTAQDPRAHRAHIGSDEARADFLDNLALVADVHRPVDSAVLTGDLSISERQGLERGKAYVVQLVNDKGEVVAKTSAILK